MTDLSKLAASLTDAQKRAVRCFTREWLAGPHVSPKTLDCIDGLRIARLVGREFLDMAPPKTAANGRRVKFAISACWHFRLTETGVALRAYLERNPL